MSRIKKRERVLAANDSRLQKSTRRQVKKKWQHLTETSKLVSRVRKKNPGSFIVSHKKHRVYIGVNLRPPASESAIIHYKPDWPRRWPQQSRGWPAPALVALSAMSNSYTCKPPLSPSLHWPWPEAVWGILESLNELKDQTNERSVRWPRLFFFSWFSREYWGKTIPQRRREKQSSTHENKNPLIITRGNFLKHHGFHGNYPCERVPGSYLRAQNTAWIQNTRSPSPSPVHTHMHTHFECET